MERTKYGIDDIMQMASDVDELTTPYNESYNELERQVKIGYLLNAFMINGTRPEELRIAVNAKLDDELD